MRLGVSVRHGSARLAVVAACVFATVGVTPLAGAAHLAAPGVDQKVAAEVPTAIKKNGMVVVAADATYAPNEFVAANGKTVVGMDADLAAALGSVMGLK